MGGEEVGVSVAVGGMTTPVVGVDDGGIDVGGMDVGGTTVAGMEVGVRLGVTVGVGVGVGRLRVRKTRFSA